MTTALATNGNGALAIDDRALLALVTEGDCGKLTEAQKLSYYRARCDAAGLDYRAQPFQFVKLNNKLVLYALKACSEQLAAKHGLVRAPRRDAGRRAGAGGFRWMPGVHRARYREGRPGDGRRGGGDDQERFRGHAGERDHEGRDQGEAAGGARALWAGNARRDGDRDHPPGPAGEDDDHRPRRGADRR
jgi:hypothetical protein